MPGNDVLLDTNALIALIGRDQGLIDLLASPGDIHVSLFTLGEMYYGIAKSARPEANRRALEGMLTQLKVLLPDSESASVYGSVFEKLRRAGRPIPTNDVWISAVAIQHGFPIVTRDAHFDQVEGLATIAW